VASTDIDLLQMRHTAIACSHCDVLELHIHVVFGCDLSALISIAEAREWSAPSRSLPR
jgi:hypothetical protein